MAISSPIIDLPLVTIWRCLAANLQHLRAASSAVTA